MVDKPRLDVMKDVFGQNFTRFVAFKEDMFFGKVYAFWRFARRRNLTKCLFFYCWWVGAMSVCALLRQIVVAFRCAGLTSDTTLVCFLLLAPYPQIPASRWTFSGINRTHAAQSR